GVSRPSKSVVLTAARLDPVRERLQRELFAHVLLDEREARVLHERDRIAQALRADLARVVLEVGDAIDGVDELGRALADAQRVAQPQLAQGQHLVERTRPCAALAPAPRPRGL